MWVVLQTSLYIPNKVRHPYKKGPKRDPNLAASTNFRACKPGLSLPGEVAGPRLRLKPHGRHTLRVFGSGLVLSHASGLRSFSVLGFVFSESWALGLQG